FQITKRNVEYAAAEKTPAEPQGAGSGGVLNIPFCDLELGTKLGEGGFSEVYSATWKSRRQAVAVKILKGSAILSPRVKAAFMDELRLMSAFRFPHIPTLFGACIDGGDACLVMELGKYSLSAELEDSRDPVMVS